MRASTSLVVALALVWSSVVALPAAVAAPVGRWVLEGSSVVEQRVLDNSKWFYGHGFSLSARGGSSTEEWTDPGDGAKGKVTTTARWSMPSVLTPETKASFPVSMDAVMEWESKQAACHVVDNAMTITVDGSVVAEVSCEGSAYTLPKPVAERPVSFQVPGGRPGATLSVRIFYTAAGGSGLVDFRYRFTAAEGQATAPAASPVPATPAPSGVWCLQSSIMGRRDDPMDTKTESWHTFDIGAEGGSGSVDWSEGRKASGSVACKATWNLPSRLAPGTQGKAWVTMAIRADKNKGRKELSHWMTLKADGRLAGKLTCQGPSDALPGMVAQAVVFDVPPARTGILPVEVVYHTPGGEGSWVFYYLLRE